MTTLMAKSLWAFPGLFPAGAVREPERPGRPSPTPGASRGLSWLGLGGLVVVSLAGEFGGAGLPELFTRLGWAEVVGDQLEQGLGSLVPEFFGAFHAAVDGLDRPLDVAAGDGQAPAAVLGIIHARALVAELAHRIGDALLGRGLGVAFGRQSEFSLSCAQLFPNAVDGAAPQPLRPWAIRGSNL